MFGHKKNLHEAILQDDAAQVTNIASHMNLKGRKAYRDACFLAVENNKSKALEALFGALEKGSAFYFNSSMSNGDKATALKLVKAAYASSDPVPLLSVLWDANKTTGVGKLDVWNFINKDSSVELVQSILQRDPDAFGVCMKQRGAHSTAEELDRILAYAPTDFAVQHVLGGLLAEVASTGDVEKAKVLLKHKANPDYSSAWPIRYAAEHGHQEMVSLLLPLVCLALYGNDIVAKLEAMKTAPADIIATIKAATEKATVAASPQPQEDTKDGFTPVNDHMLFEKTTLPDGSTQAITLDFSLRQEFCTVTTPAGIPTTTVVNFDKLPPGVVDEMQKKLDAPNHKTSPAPLRLHV